MKYLRIKEIGQIWGISERRVRVMCQRGQIEGAVRQGKLWLIPENTQKPTDGRFTKTAQQYIGLYRLRAEINRCRPLTSGEKERLAQIFTAEYTYNSNAIEGNTLTLAETELVLAGNTVSEKPLKDHLEAVGHKDAFDYILSIVREKNIVNEKIIKDIHSLVLADKPMDRGVYRKVPVRIAGAKDIPTEPYLIEEKLKQLIMDYKKSDKNLFEKISLFHLKFESIHPFIDGNGRCGRLILNLMLMQEGFLPINIKFADRVKYYECFRIYSETGDYKPMLNLITAYEKERLTEYLNIVK